MVVEQMERDMFVGFARTERYRSGADQKVLARGGDIYRSTIGVGAEINRTGEIKVALPIQTQEHVAGILANEQPVRAAAALDHITKFVVLNREGKPGGTPRTQSHWIAQGHSENLACLKE